MLLARNFRTNDDVIETFSQYTLFTSTKNSQNGALKDHFAREKAGYCQAEICGNGKVFMVRRM
jgi:hypothetical protein